MSYGFEDLVAQAKHTNPLGYGAAADKGAAVFFYDFGKNPAGGTVGQKHTGLLIPPNTLVESGLVLAESAVAGGFNLQLLASGDILPAQTTLAANAIANLVRIANPNIEREVLLNVTAATTGSILAWFRLLPF